MQPPFIVFSTTCRTLLPVYGPDVHPPVRQNDAARSPEVGSLPWLLAYGLSPAQNQGGTSQVSTGQTGQTGQQKQSWFSAPAAVPAQSLRDQARMTLADKLADDFKIRLGVAPTRPDAPPAERRKTLQKSMATAYLLGLAIPPRLAGGLNKVEEWTPQEVFGCSAGQLVGLLRRLRLETLAELEVNKIPAGEVRDEVIQAAGDFWAYVDECIENVAEMRRSDGSRPRQLSPDTQARLKYMADNLT